MGLLADGPYRVRLGRSKVVHQCGMNCRTDCGVLFWFVGRSYPGLTRRPYATVTEDPTSCLACLAYDPKEK